MTSFELSIPKAKKVHGIEINKLVIADYIDLSYTLADLPSELCKELFGTNNVLEVVLYLQKIDAVKATELIKTALKLPKVILETASRIMGVPSEELAKLTPNQLLDVLEIFLDENEYADFFAKGRRLVQRLLPKVSARGGSSGS